MEDIFKHLGINDTSRDFNKQDILQLLQVGLKENQPFAKYFAETILADIQRKLKDLKIQSTAIEIDGAAISKDINDSIKNGISKDLDNTVKKINKEIVDTSKSLSKGKQTKNEFNLSSIFTPPGDNTYPLQGLTYAMQWNNLRKDILKKIRPPKNIIRLEEKDINLSSIFAPPGDNLYPLQGLTYAMQWNNLKKDVLKRIRPPAGDIVLNKKNINLSSIFAPPGDNIYPLQGLTYAWQWNNLKKDILKKIRPQSGDIVLNKKNINLSSIFAPPDDNTYPLQGLTYAWQWNNLKKDILKKIRPSARDIILNKENINLSSIFAPPGDNIYPLQNLTYAWQWNKLRKDILKKILPPTENIVLGKENINLNTIMGETPEMSIFTRMKWGKLQRDILDKISKDIKGSKSSGTKGTDKAKTEKQKSKREEKRDIDNSIFSKLKNSVLNLKGIEKLTIPATPKDSKKEKREFKSLEEKTQEMNIGGFSNKALKDLATLFNEKQKIKKTKDEDKEKDSGSLLSKLKDLIPNSKSIGNLMKRLGAGAAKQIGLKPLSTGSGAFATGLASAGTNLLLAKYAVDLTRMATSKKFREKKEEDVGKSLEDQSKGFMGKAMTGVVNLPSVITGYFSEKEKQQKLKIEGSKSSFSSKKALEEAAEKAVGKESLKEIKKKAFNDPTLKNASKSGDMDKYDDLYQRFLSSEVRRMRQEQLLKEKEKENVKPVLAATPVSNTNEITKINRAEEPIKKVEVPASMPVTKTDENAAKEMKNNQTEIQNNLQQNQLLIKSIDKLMIKMDTTMNIISENIKQRSMMPAPTPQNTPDISDDAGDLRDPAYVLRSRAWDRLRKGYVVL